MANQAAVAIEKARLHEEEIKMQALESDLAVARQIQLSLLPNTPPVVPGWEFATFYEAAREVGGDFYDFLEFPGAPDRLGLVIADVTGKGVPAALFMARTSTMIRAAARRGWGPAETLAEANVLVSQDRRLSLLLTAFYATLDTRQGRLAYASAGHNPPLWLSATAGCCQELKARGMLMGAFDHIELEERVIDLAPGDLVVLYTEHQQFGEERLVATVAARADASAQQVVDAVVGAVRSFTGDIPQSDDLTLLVIRRCPPSSP
jgi:sigma-B regulation protein RsbU (phosphoserine phosphatase)